MSAKPRIKSNTITLKVTITERLALGWTASGTVEAHGVQREVKTNGYHQTPAAAVSALMASATFA